MISHFLLALSLSPGLHGPSLGEESECEADETREAGQAKAQPGECSGLLVTGRLRL